MALSACGCTRSVAFVSALFAGLAAAALLAESRCLEAGGRIGDSAWICLGAAGASDSIWSLVSPMAAGLVVLAVGAPVFLLVDLLGRRLIGRAARRSGA